MNEENSNNTNLNDNRNINVNTTESSISDNRDINTSNSNTNGDSMDNNIVNSTIEQQAYKELYEQQKSEIQALKEEINKVKLANQKLAIQQNTGTPHVTAEELINKMFN